MRPRISVESGWKTAVRLVDFRPAECGYPARQVGSREPGVPLYSWPEIRHRTPKRSNCERLNQFGITCFKTRRNHRSRALLMELTEKSEKRKAWLWNYKASLLSWALESKKINVTVRENYQTINAHRSNDSSGAHLFALKSVGHRRGGSTPTLFYVTPAQLLMRFCSP